ncbi:MAG: SPOR domain-containing protein, partial [Gammaproteobacteria bacterium]
AFLWLFTILALGLFVVGLYYLHERKSINQPPLLSTIHHKTKVKPHTIKSKAHKMKELTESEPRFDFYTELPKMKVWVPNAKEHETHSTPKAPPLLNSNEPVNVSKTETSPTEPVKAVSSESIKPIAAETENKTISTKAPEKKYVVQVASLENTKQIDQLKAQLSLLGFRVNITDVTLNKKSMHRVWIGPFSSINDALKAQKDLVAENIKGTVINSKE